MSTVLTGAAAGGAADPVAITAPAAGDYVQSGPIQTLLQKIIDTEQNIRAAVTSAHDTAVSTSEAYTDTQIAALGLGGSAPAPVWSDLGVSPSGNWDANTAITYWKDSLGIVHVRAILFASGFQCGLVRALGNTALPAGCRPQAARPLIYSMTTTAVAATAVPQVVGGNTYNWVGGYILIKDDGSVAGDVNLDPAATPTTYGYAVFEVAFVPGA